MVAWLESPTSLVLVVPALMHTRLIASYLHEVWELHLELDKALTHCMGSFVDTAQGGSQAPHAHLHLSPHGGVAAQRGEEVLGRGGDLVRRHELLAVWHGGHCTQMDSFRMVKTPLIWKVFFAAAQE